jgi:hypothetical protein
VPAKPCGLMPPSRPPASGGRLRPEPASERAYRAGPGAIRGPACLAAALAALLVWPSAAEAASPCLLKANRGGGRIVAESGKRKTFEHASTKSAWRPPNGVRYLFLR